MEEKKYVIISEKKVRTMEMDHESDLKDYVEEKVGTNNFIIVNNDWDVSGKYMVVELNMGVNLDV